MPTNVEKINMKIKSTWENFFLVSFFVVAIIAIAFFVLGLKERKYQKEYESTTWREVEAVLDHNFYHQNKEYHYNEDEEWYEYVDYYDWVFTYQGRDGNSYTYVEKNNSFAAGEHYSTTIYVDEKDDSHSLEIKDSSSGKEMRLFIVIVIGIPYTILYAIILTILYIRKFLAKK